MNTLPKDMVEKLIDELSPQDFISFCSSNVDPNVTRICNMEEIWERRMRRDFQEVLIVYPDVINTPKRVYLSLFTEISKAAEQITEIVLSGYGKVRKYLSLEFNKFLYNEFFQISLKALIYILKEINELDDALTENNVKIFVSETIPDILYSDDFIAFMDEYFPNGSFDYYNNQLYNNWESAIKKPLREFLQTIIIFLQKY